MYRILVILLLLVGSFIQVFPSDTDQTGLNREKWKELRKKYQYTDIKPKKEKEDTPTQQEEPEKIAQETDSSLLRTVLVSVIVIVIVVVLIVIIRRSRFDKKVDTTRVEAESIEDAEENLPEVKLNNIFQKAVNNEDFRSALRIKFLMVLQQMIDQNLIEWKKRKTNEQFIAEISHPLIQANFSALVQAYDNVWYGELSLTQKEFEYTVKRIDELNLEIHHESE